MNVLLAETKPSLLRRRPLHVLSLASTSHTALGSGIASRVRRGRCKLGHAWRMASDIERVERAD